MQNFNTLPCKYLMSKKPKKNYLSWNQKHLEWNPALLLSLLMVIFERVMFAALSLVNGEDVLASRRDGLPP